MTENLHKNPNNLNFYLSKTGLKKSTFEIIKKQNFNSIFGEIEIAIIGESHYFLIKGQFIEIMTCSEEKYTNEDLIFTEKESKNFTFNHQFHLFTYQFSVVTDYFSDSESFFNFEKKLLADSESFSYAFAKNSAITSINYTSSKNKFVLLTYHTYPEYNKIIRSRTELILK